MFTNGSVKTGSQYFQGVEKTLGIATEQYGDTLRVCLMDPSLDHPDQKCRTVCDQIEAITNEYYSGLQGSRAPASAQTKIHPLQYSFEKIRDFANSVFTGQKKPDIKFYVYLPQSSKRANESLSEVPLTFKDGKFVLNGNDWIQHSFISPYITRDLKYIMPVPTAPALP